MSAKVPEKKDSAKGAKDDKPARIPYPEMKNMPDDLKSELDRRLSEGLFRSCRTLAKWLGDNGYQISEDTLQKYGKKFDRRLDAIRLATEQARIVCEQFKDDDADMQTALLRLVQTRLFEVLSAVNQETRSTTRESGEETIAPVNITALARCVSGLAKAESENRKWAEHTRAAVAAAAKKLDDSHGKGLSPKAAAQIRSVLMGI